MQFSFKMSGIYVHIPFCRQACHYCDFHFSTNLKLIDNVIDAICDELKHRKDYLTTPVETVYFGGGTPSLLASAKIEKILNQIRDLYSLTDSLEMTLEANPEDLTLEKCQKLKKIGINRLSIGFQTFDHHKLQWMNRAHNMFQSHEAYQNARRVGFDNISLDLMYALPEETDELFNNDLNEIVALKPEHISLYGLTIEEQTVFGRRKEKGNFVETPEEKAAKQYLDAISFLNANDYVQYEVSNFGREGFYSRHNFGYWNHAPYLGVGPGAHSYNQISRRFNIRNNPKYVQALQKGGAYFNEEMLTKTEQLNERILTGLRTTDGIDCNKIMQLFGINLMKEKKEFFTKMTKQKLLKIQGDRIKLHAEGFLVADEIALQLFFHE